MPRTPDKIYESVLEKLGKLIEEAEAELAEYHKKK
jgi:hypothetical protein